MKVDPSGNRTVQNGTAAAGATNEQETSGAWRVRISWALMIALSVFATSTRGDDESYKFDIPASIASTALNLFAQQSNTPLLYLDEVVRDRHTNDVTGTYSVGEALEILLRDSGLTGSINATGVLAISVAEPADEKGSNMETKSDKAKRKLSLVASLGAMLANVFAPATAIGQESGDTTDDRIEEIVVTGTKKVGGESVHETPLAVTVIGREQLVDAQIRDLYDLGAIVPNAYLIGTGTFPGTATFSMRGMAINNSIPSSTPTVGVFLDDIYMGVASGLVLDMFDIASIEALRGPQGLLFGRNVTAGAILQRTTLPTDTFEASLQASVETGPRFTESAIISGPLSNDVLGKIAVYRSDDDGWFTNNFNGDSFGELRNTRIHAATTVWPDNDFRAVLRVYYSDTDGDGPAVQNHGEFDRHNFDFAINEPGFIKVEWTQASIELIKDVAFGNGQIVNLLGYREVDQETLTDFDGTDQPIFNVSSALRHDQISNELRYSGLFGSVGVTAGLYYYSDDLFYVEGRSLFGGTLNLVGGGELESRTLAIYSSVDIALSPNWTLNLGARYSDEEKDAGVNQIVPAMFSGCSITAQQCSAFAFQDTNTWNDFTPKIGIEWNPNQNTHAYAFWTQGYRSGGYNLRQASAAPPGPYDQEKENSYEVGLKQQAVDGRVILKVAAFVNRFEDLQRDVSRTDPMLGSVQLTANTADMTIRGFEAELSARLTEGLTADLYAGYMDSEFDKIFFDLSGDGVVGPEDFALELPLFSPWSYGITLNYDRELTTGREASIRFSYSHRDKSFSTDDNRGFLNEVDYVDLILSLGLTDRLEVSAYGKNLTDEVFYSPDVPLPFVPGETHSPLRKGRVYGIEFRFRN